MNAAAMKALLARLRAEGRDLLELVLVPGLAAVLPWRVCFAVFRLLARWRFLYGAACDAALAGARERGRAGDGPAAEQAFLRARRLLTIVDHADMYLARTRADAWMKRHLRVTGQWPATGEAALLLTFHWGAGMWGLRHAAAAGLTPNALVAELRPEHFTGRSLAYRYARARNATVARALRRPPLDASADLRPALKALRAREPVLAAVDVPADNVAASEPIQFLGQQARAPRALFRLAVERRIPVTVYLTGIDMANGARFLRIHNLGARDDVAALVGDVFALLEQAVRDDPAAWHFWGVAERFFGAGRDS